MAAIRAALHNRVNDGVSVRGNDRVPDRVNDGVDDGVDDGVRVTHMLRV